MALSILLSFLATSLLLLQPIVATDDALPPILSPLWNAVCDAIDCGKGSCKSSMNHTMPFICECNSGWRQFQIEDDFRFLPCVIPNCTLNYSCNAPAPVAAPPLHPANHSIFDPCAWAYCGKGTCMKTSNFGHKCECGDGYANLLNVTNFPCFSECALGADCLNLGFGLTNRSSATGPPSLSDSGRGVNNGCSSLSSNLLWSIIVVISLAMVTSL